MAYAYVCSHVEVALSQPWFVPRSLLTGWRREALAQAFAGKAGRDELAMPSADASVGAPVSRLVSQSGAEKAPAAQSLPASSSSPATDEARPNQPHLTYQANVANHLARRFYERNGFQVDEMAMECGRTEGRDYLLMTCRHCLRYEFGWCRKRGGAAAQLAEPLYLNLNDGRRFRLEFDCRRCEMKVWNA